MEVTRRPGLGALEDGAELLAGARPTAVNLAWAVERVRAAALAAGPVSMAGAARAEAERDPRRGGRRERGDRPPRRRSAAPARGASLTICNTGALAAGGAGTALAVILELHRRAPGAVRVLACETRPLLQGARLTAWELAARRRRRTSWSSTAPPPG